LFLRLALLLITLISFHFVCAQQNEYRGFVHKNPPNKLNFQLFPNPYTGGKLYIASAPAEIKNIMIINILGEVIYNNEITKSNSGDYTVQLNLKDSPSGVYFASVSINGEQKTVKINLTK